MHGKDWPLFYHFFFNLRISLQGNLTEMIKNMLMGAVSLSGYIFAKEINPPDTEPSGQSYWGDVLEIIAGLLECFFD